MFEFQVLNNIMSQRSTLCSTKRLMMNTKSTTTTTKTTSSTQATTSSLLYLITFIFVVLLGTGTAFRVDHNTILNSPTPSAKEHFFSYLWKLLPELSTSKIKFGEIQQQMISTNQKSMPSYSIPEGYDWNKSTMANYKNNKPPHHNDDFVGEFQSIRRNKLDYNYHEHYIPQRQLFQDSIIQHFLSKPRVVDKNGQTCHSPTQPWIVFTAGAMGAGKSYTIKKLAKEDFFPLESFVMVDPDEIRRHLPEFYDYDSQQAGEMTRLEAGMIAELLTLVALSNGQNVLVDGSLKDSVWYQQYFAQLRTDYPWLQIAILHITAPKQAVLDRAQSRSLKTGRVVPEHTLFDALERVPQSVKILSPLVDFSCEINNTHQIEFVTEGMTWDSFRNTWSQSCGNSTAFLSSKL